MRSGRLVWIVGVLGACAGGEEQGPAALAGGASGAAAGGASGGLQGAAAAAGLPTGCPEMASFPGPMDPCAGCYGLACEPDQTCQGSFHQGDNASSYCSCVEHQMVCCVSTSRYVSCDYGGRTPPECPARPPQADEPCGPTPLACSYSNGCTEPELTAFCDGQIWLLGQRLAPSAGAAGAPCAGSEAGGAGGAP